MCGDVIITLLASIRRTIGEDHFALSLGKVLVHAFSTLPQNEALCMPRRWSSCLCEARVYFYKLTKHLPQNLVKENKQTKQISGELVDCACFLRPGNTWLCARLVWQSYLRTRGPRKESASGGESKYFLSGSLRRESRVVHTYN